jgi:N-formylglutamate amidohydrolase
VRDPAAYQLIEPLDNESAVLVEVPHAGLALDAESLAWTIAPARSIARDADVYVDALFRDAPAAGATLLCASLSRYVVDLNRGEDDVDADAVEGGGSAPFLRGLIWRFTTEGDPILRQRLPREELERRLERVYRPYHAAIERVLERKRERFGYAILLCAHSMPTEPRRGHPPGPPRADLVPGTRGRTTAADAVIDAVDAIGRAQGWSVRHDDPYKGGYSTGHYGRPAEGLHAVQVELARRLYVDEGSCRIRPTGFKGVQDFARSLVLRLGRLEL